jgi:hypothetical protein
MSIETDKQVTQCPQCDGTGKEQLFLNKKCCRRCNGKGTLEHKQKEASFMGKILTKSAFETQDENQDEPPYSGSVKYVDEDEEFDDFSDLIDQNHQQDKMGNRERIQYGNEESDGVDESLFIPTNRSDLELRSGIISMVRSMDTGNSEKLIASFQKILGEQNNEIPNAKQALSYTYDCMEKMNSEQLRLAFCVTRQFV